MIVSTFTPSSGPTDTLSITDCIARVDGSFGQGSDEAILVVIGGDPFTRDPANQGKLTAIDAAQVDPAARFRELSGRLDISITH